MRLWSVAVQVVITLFGIYFKGMAVDLRLVVLRTAVVDVRVILRFCIYLAGEGRWLPGAFRHEGGIGAWDFHPLHGLLVTGGFDDTSGSFSPKS